MPPRGQPPYVRSHQKLLNSHWPDNPKAFRNRDGIPVIARIVWERDGEEHMEGLAIRWDRDHVYVRLDQHGDVRLMTTGAWLRPEDVKRR